MSTSKRCTNRHHKECGLAHAGYAFRCECHCHPMTNAQRYKKARAAVEALTQIGTTPDGAIIVGPQGWQMVLEARA